MPLKTPAQLNVARALGSLSYEQTWQLCVEAVRRVRREGLKASTIEWDTRTFQYKFYPLLRERAAIPDSDPFDEDLSLHLREESGVNVLRFLIWLERSGLAYHLGREGLRSAVTWVRLLPAGLEFFDADQVDHLSPWLPDWVERIQKRCKRIPVDVVSGLLDAVSCFDAGLYRPAMVVAGVAFETAVEAVVRTLIRRKHLPATVLDDAAAKRISAVRNVVDTVLAGKTSQQRDDRYASKRALDFADDLRRRRNDAAHTQPRHDPRDRAEVEELLVEIGRKLPDLWRLAR